LWKHDGCGDRAHGRLNGSSLLVLFAITVWARGATGPLMATRSGLLPLMGEDAGQIIGEDVQQRHFACDARPPNTLVDRGTAALMA
jgi:hypothetical protein